MIEDEKPQITPPSSEIKPKVPDIVANLEWLRRHGRRHWRIITCAVMVLLTGWVLSMPSALVGLKGITEALINWRILRTVDELRVLYPKARDSLAKGSGDFSEVEAAIDVILKLDPRNGHGLYYAGEVKRIQHKVLFTPKSCVQTSWLATHLEPLQEYENEFERYLDVERSLVDNQRKGDYSSETCYKRPKGYCPQRTAWVHHLLANDLLEEGMVLSNPGVKADRFRRALAHAQAAATLYKDEQNQPGFDKCKPTTLLISEAEKAITSIRP